MALGIGRGIARFPPPSETSSMFDDREPTESEASLAPLRRPGQAAPIPSYMGQAAPIAPRVNDMPREPPPKLEKDRFFGGEEDCKLNLINESAFYKSLILVLGSKFKFVLCKTTPLNNKTLDSYSKCWCLF